MSRISSGRAGLSGALGKGEAAGEMRASGFVLKPASMLSCSRVGGLRS